MAEEYCNGLNDQTLSSLLFFQATLQAQIIAMLQATKFFVWAYRRSFLSPNCFIVNKWNPALRIVLNSSGSDISLVLHLCLSLWRRAKFMSWGWGWRWVDDSSWCSLDTDAKFLIISVPLIVMKRWFPCCFNRVFENKLSEEQFRDHKHKLDLVERR